MRVLLLTAMLLAGTLTRANEIDRLRTPDEVNRFIAARVGNRYEGEMLLSNDSEPGDAGRIARNQFFKVDVDGDRLTDLVIYGRQGLVVVRDLGNGAYARQYIDEGDKVDLLSIDMGSTPARLIIDTKENVRYDTVINGRKRTFQRADRFVHRVDTLVLAAGEFVEGRGKPSQRFTFGQLVYKTGPCFGKCPMFELTIRKNGTAIYRAQQFNERTGVFTAKIPQPELNRLMELLRTIGWDRLKDEYAVGWTDDQTVYTVINYNGKTKSIKDYGKKGSIGLQSLYRLLTGWRASLDWKPADQQR